MLFFIAILIILTIIFIIIIFSSLRLTVNNFEISNSNNELKPTYELKIGLYFLEKIKIFNIKINNEKAKKFLEKDFIKEKIEKAKNKSLKQKKIQNQIIKQIIKKLEIKNINLIILIDTKNVILTSYLVGMISSIIPNILCRNIKKFDTNNHKFKITPLYKNQNYIYIKLNSIISIKIVHIISMYKVGKKYKGGIKNERSSYRRFNVSCYGKY